MTLHDVLDPTAQPQSDFIPVAEDTGLILPLGQWVLREAVMQLARWRRTAGAEGIFVSVNLSKRQLLEPGLVTTVENLLRETGVPAARIKLEITESIIMDSAVSVSPVLRQLRDAGLSLWMDDFGTGHSSLSCIQTFPLDGMKIDRAFIQNLETSPSYSAVVQAIVTLVKNLRLTVVAEGIETAQQLVLVQTLDRDQGQGWYFAKALPAAECEPLLVAGRRIVDLFLA